MAAQHIKEKVGDFLHPDQATHQVTTPNAAAGFPTIVPNATKADSIPEPDSESGSKPGVSSETHFMATPYRSNQAPPSVPLDDAAMLGIPPVPTPPGRSAPAVPKEQESATAPTTPPPDDIGLDGIGEEQNSDSRELPIIPVSDVETKDRDVIESDVKTKNYPAPQPDVQEKNLPGTEPEGENTGD